MSSPEILNLVIPFAVAFAMTHLIVLPLKAFFLNGDLRHIAVRAATWNLLALVYTVTVVFISGVEAHTGVWDTIKFIPTMAIFAFSIGVWLYVMVRATKKFMLIDVVVFTIMAFAAS